MGHDEIYIAKRCFGVGAIAEGDLGSLLFQQDFAGFGDDLLTGTIVVVEFDLLEREAMLIFQQHQNDTRSKSAATTGNDYREFFHDHDSITKDDC